MLYKKKHKIHIATIGAKSHSKMPTSFVLSFRCECYDYLFDIAVQMKQHGLDPTAVPKEENGIV